MTNKSVVVRFCPIDAKDNVDCGYRPVAFSDEKGPTELGRVNGRLLMMMNREYLVRLRALQEEIAAGYEPRFVDGDRPSEEIWGSGMNKSEYDEAVKESVSRFPGREAGYYT